MSYKRQELFTLRENLGSLGFVCGVHVTHLFSLLCCVVFLCFVCLLPVSCVPNVARFSELPILYCPSGFP